MISETTFKSGTCIIVSLLFFLNTISSQEINLKTGSWNGRLQLNDSTVLPFSYDIKSDFGISTFTFKNGVEQIVANEMVIQKDSIFLKMPVFDSEFRCKMMNDHELNGTWINYARQERNRIAFSANYIYKQTICYNTSKNNAFSDSIKINYETTFSPQSKNSSKAIGIFEKKDAENIHGTFLTETGDYRYLSGKIKCNDNQRFYLSCFDGSHAFLFTGKINDDSIINGHFYSGTHWHEPWSAIRNNTFKLRNPDSLTYLKSVADKIAFSFKNTEGKTVALSDEKYKNKVVIIQLMGSWCPNCMDETAFLAPLYEENKSKGLEIIALAFEKTTDFTKAANNVSRLKKRYNANYEFLITEKSGKDQATSVLPMLNEIMAFPTTIFIDRKGNVRKIYTGFSGPGTGEYYTRFTEQTNLFLEKLLLE